MPPGEGPLRNGCFLECIAALRARLAAGCEPRRPRLLAFYEGAAAGGRGHTVLAYECHGRWEVRDAQEHAPPPEFSLDAFEEPLLIARSLAGPRVTKTRLLPLDLPPGRATPLASGGVSDDVPGARRSVAFCWELCRSRATRRATGVFWRGRRPDCRCCALAGRKRIERRR